MPEAVIVALGRSPIGRAFKGHLVDVRPDDLASYVVTKVLEKVPEVEPSMIDDLICGCGLPGGEQGHNLGRVVSILARLDTPGCTITRYCSSSLQTTRMAAHAIKAGEGDVFLSVGVECVSRYGNGTSDPQTTHNPRLERGNAEEYPDIYIQMGETAENVAAKYRIPRAKQDEFALSSHQRALAAQEAGRYRAELLPVTVPGKQAVFVERDEGPRADTSLEKLSKLKPAFRDGGTVTAGNSSSLNDGAAAILLASARKAAELGLKPLARVVAAASAGVDPREMGMGPVPATQKALKKAGLSVGKLDLVELNEAFAAQSLAVIQELKLDPGRVNVDGGAISMGHPLGMSGARILGHLAHALKARGGKFGLATLCVGVGQGVSVIVEAV